MKNTHSNKRRNYIYYNKEVEEKLYSIFVIHVWKILKHQVKGI